MFVILDELCSHGCYHPCLIRFYAPSWLPIKSIIKTLQLFKNTTLMKLIYGYILYIFDCFYPFRIMHLLLFLHERLSIFCFSLGRSPCQFHLFKVSLKGVSQGHFWPFLFTFAWRIPS